MPPYSAAFLFCPTVVMRKPIVVRSTSHQMTTAAMAARNQPTGSPQMSGIFADSWIAGVREMAPPVVVVERTPRPDEVFGHVDEDGVEHDRRDHLVRPSVGLEVTGERRRQHAEDAADDEGERHVEHGREVGEPVAHPRREDRTEQQLALGADVEQPGLHADDHGEAGERDRRRPGQRAGEVVLVPERPVDERRVRRPRVRPVQPDQHRAERGGRGRPRRSAGGCSRPAGSVSRHELRWSVDAQDATRCGRVCRTSSPCYVMSRPTACSRSRSRRTGCPP